MAENVFVAFIPMVGSVGLFALIAWIVFVVVDGKRRREHLKVSSEFHAKILEKLGSAGEFGAFMETDGGKRLMKSLAVEGPSAKTRMLASMQTGIVATAIGVAMLILGGIFHYLLDGLWVMGGIITACGIGFLASTLASYRLSKTLGLLGGDDEAARR